MMHLFSISVLQLRAFVAFDYYRNFVLDTTQINFTRRVYILNAYLRSCAMKNRSDGKVAYLYTRPLWTTATKRFIRMRCKGFLKERTREHFCVLIIQGENELLRGWISCTLKAAAERTKRTTQHNNKTPLHDGVWG